MWPCAATSAPSDDEGQDHRPPRRPADHGTLRRHVPERCSTIRIPGVEIFVEPVREHRFVVVFRGDDLGDTVNDTDPQSDRRAALDGEGARRRIAKTRPASSTSSSPRRARC